MIYRDIALLLIILSMKDENSKIGLCFLTIILSMNNKKSITEGVPGKLLGKIGGKAAKKGGQGAAEKLAKNAAKEAAAKKLAKNLAKDAAKEAATKKAAKATKKAAKEAAQEATEKAKKEAAKEAAAKKLAKEAAEKSGKKTTNVVSEEAAEKAAKEAAEKATKDTAKKATKRMSVKNAAKGALKTCGKNKLGCVALGFAAYTGIEYAMLKANEKECMEYCQIENIDAYQQKESNERVFRTKETFQANPAFSELDWDDVKSNICSNKIGYPEGKTEDDYPDGDYPDNISVEKRKLPKMRDGELRIREETPNGNEECTSFCTEKCAPSYWKVLGENVGEAGGGALEVAGEVGGGALEVAGEVGGGVLDALGIDLDKLDDFGEWLKYILYIFFGICFIFIAYKVIVIIKTFGIVDYFSGKKEAVPVAAPAMPVAVPVAAPAAAAAPVDPGGPCCPCPSAAAAKADDFLTDVQKSVQDKIIKYI